MLEFIKGLFRKEEEKKQVIEEISLDSLQAWSAKKRQNIEQDIESFLETVKPEFEDVVSECKTAIAVLRNASLMNPNIPEMEKILMEGNRDSFTKSAERLLGQLSFPAAINLAVFFESSDNAFRNYEKMSLRPFAILQHFFEHESKAVHSGVHRLFLIVSRIKDFHSSSGILNAFEAGQEAKEILGIVALNKELEKKLIEIDDALEQKEESITAKQKELDNSQEFLDYAQLLQKKEAIIKSIEGVNSELGSIFSALKVPLQKLARLRPEFEKKIAICENFCHALPNDEAAIIEVMAALKNELESNSLDLKDKKRESALQKVALITKDFLDSWNKKRKLLAENLNALEQEVLASGAGKKQESFKREIEMLAASKRELELEKMSLSKKHSTENLAKRVSNFEAKNTVRINRI